jgi:nucleotide-binding universal stress UspA family protein
MSSFQNILVGIDLARPGRPDSPLGPAAAAAVETAVWVARGGGGRLTFFSALPSAPHGAEAARQLLADLACDAGAEAVVVPGKGWLEIVRRVLREHHDLVVVGARDEGGLMHRWFGGTAQKLVHECPCPVWVARARPGPGPRGVLVASDLSPVSDGALRLALPLARLARAPVHLLHVVDYPLDRHWSPGPADATTRAYHGSVRAEAEHALHAQLARCGRVPEDRVELHLADSDGLADHAILGFLRDHAIDLLVLGDVARHGLAKLFLGNMAERLLSEVSCSVLVVKPADFRSAVSVD